MSDSKMLVKNKDNHGKMIRILQKNYTHQFEKEKQFLLY